MLETIGTILACLIGLLVCIAALGAGNYHHKDLISPRMRKLMNKGYNVHKMIKGEYPNIKVRRVGYEKH